MEPLVLSVNITSCNYGQYLGQAIESILSQTFKNFELIIVDDNSNDNSVEIVKYYMEKDSRIRLVEHAVNKGFSASLIEASEASQGRYMVHLDADDWIIDAQAFELQITLMEDNPEIAFAYSPEAHFTNEGRCTRLRQAFDIDTVWSRGEGLEKVLAFYVAHSGTMVRTSAYKACGGYNNSFRYAIDLKLWIDLCVQGKVGYINRLLYAYRQHGVSMSNFSGLTLQEEMLKAVKSGLNGPLAKEIGEPTKHAKILRHTLVAGPLHDIFSGRYKRGWLLYLASLRIMPCETLLQKITPILVARTLLGSKGYSLLNKTYAKVSRRKNQKMQKDAHSQAQILGKAQTRN